MHQLRFLGRQELKGQKSWEVMGEGDKDGEENAPDRGSTCAKIMSAQLTTLGDFSQAWLMSSWDTLA